MRVNRFYTLTILLLVVLLTACTKHRTYTSSIIGFQFSHANNSGRTPRVSSADTLPAKAYAITMTQLGLITGHDDGSDVETENNYNVSNRPQRISITILNDYDTIHPAGTLLNEYFNLLKDTVSYELTGLGNSYLYPAFDFHGRANDQDTLTSTSWLVLMHPPKAPGSYSFAINVVLEDSVRLFDTLHIYLK
ncbi:MAG: DUF5034 domain-containing protein [Taibaiella sp.]|nr:DUF5034 domain-containing protein [Taibaiella sp.]